MEEAPDLVVGYREGYRGSWKNALGGVPQSLVEDNSSKWSGDHCIDPSLVPGILLSNRPISKDDPSLMDLAPTILNLLGMPFPAAMDGSDLFEK
jgi:bisphosphoglycerate-independent phosphoglycerate mutase (AlkP superfamily)